MSTEQPRTSAWSRLPVRWRWITGLAVAVVVVLAVILAFAVTSAQDPSAVGPSRSGAASVPASPSPSPSSSAPASAQPVDPTASASPADPGNPQPTASPAPINSTVEVLPQVQVQIMRLEAVDGIAGPGEVAGPAIRFAVVLTNGSDKPIPLQTAVVNVDYGPERTPAGELDEPGGSPLVGQVEPGQSIEGVYIFTVPADQRNSVRITVDYSVDVAPLLFEGSAPS